MPPRLAVPGARFEHLMCCYDNNRLQGDLKGADETCAQQDHDLMDLHHARSEDVAKLSHEAAALRRLLQQPEDLLCEEEDFWGTSAPALERSEPGRGEAAQRAELEAARQQAQQAQKEAAFARARLAIFRESCGQEMQQLLLHAAQRRRAGRALPGAGGMLAFAAMGVGSAALDPIAWQEQQQVRELHKQCEGLQGPASLLLSAFQQPLLGPVPALGHGPGQARDAERLEEWLSALSGSVQDLCDQLSPPSSPSRGGQVDDSVECTDEGTPYSHQP